MTHEKNLCFRITTCHSNYHFTTRGVYSRYHSGWWGTELLSPVELDEEAWCGRHYARPLTAVLIIHYRENRDIHMKLFWENVARFKFHYWWLVIIAMIMHRLPFFLYTPSEAVGLKKVAMIVSYLLLIFTVSRNLKIWGFRLVLIGVLLNFVAISFNGGLMPVTTEARIGAGMSSVEQVVIGGVLPEGSGILLTVEQTKLWLLTDIIPVEKLGAVCSIGDLIILVGMVVLVIQIIYQSYPRKGIHQKIPLINPIVTESEKT
jgi:hypothetical protein